MDWKQMMRGKLACGFSCRRDASGRVEGHGVVKLPKRNAYEIIGLRRPVRREILRLRPSPLRRGTRPCSFGGDLDHVATGSWAHNV